MTSMKIQSTRGFDEELIFGNGGSGMVYEAGMSLNLVLLLVTIATGLCGLDYFHNGVVVRNRITHRDIKSANLLMNTFSAFTVRLTRIWKGLQP
ncbi:hypothetical protein L1987_01514 [Smallanthus sonchifolius]|uniref:Uncharacterized protein n=1 Tax=Smallanthus sonchifolius TaxID=185202 RepID=A0ACB9K5B0_9ASTR|nr:hypothetical protein L1987_01514 [Smallanthus sonchifolius]